MSILFPKCVQPLDIYRLSLWMQVLFFSPDDVSKMCPKIWTYFRHILDTLWTHSKVSKNYSGLDPFWTQYTKLDTFWTLFGHWRYGHILDILWTHLYISCPKYVQSMSKICPSLFCSVAPNWIPTKKTSFWGHYDL